MKLKDDLIPAVPRGRTGVPELVQEHQVEEEAISTAKVAPEAIDGTRIAPLAVTAGHLVDGAVDLAGTKVAGQLSLATQVKDQLDGGKLGAQSVKADRIADAVPAVNGTNLALWSEQFENAVWINVFRTVTPNQAEAPDGSTTADLVDTAGHNGGSVLQVVSIPTTGTYTFSVWLRAVSGTIAPQVRLYRQGDGIQAADNTVATTTWRRYAASLALNAGDTVRLWIFPAGTSAQGSILCWGAALNQGAAAGPYVRTTNAQAINQPSTYPFTGGIQESQVLPKSLTAASLSDTANILGSQLDPAAAIAHGQIASIDAAKITVGQVDLATQVKNVLPAAKVGAGYDPANLGAGTLSGAVDVPAASLSGAVDLTTQVGGILPAANMDPAFPADLSVASGTLPVAKVASGYPAASLAGSIADSQIAAVSASKVSGSLSSATLPAASIDTSVSKIASGQIDTIVPSQIDTSLGTIPASKVASIPTSQLSGTINLATQVSGTLPGGSVGTGINAANVTTGTLPSARIGVGAVSGAKGGEASGSQIADTSIAQEQLQVGCIGDPQLQDLAVPNRALQSGIDASKITVGTMSGARVGSGISAANVTTGTLDSARLPTAEPVRAVGAAGQPAFTNGWTNFGGGFRAAGFWKDQFGLVHLEGLIKSGTVGSGSTAYAFTLPLGYRPSAAHFCVTLSNDALGQARVNTNGGVEILPPSSNTWVSLDGITFRTT